MQEYHFEPGDKGCWDGDNPLIPLLPLSIKNVNPKDDEDKNKNLAKSKPKR